MGYDHSENSPNKPALAGLDCAGLRIGIAVSRFNQQITSLLYSSALKELSDLGVLSEAIFTRWVPGAFELPLMAQCLIDAHDVDAVILLGCVIRGETPHFEYICQACAHGAQQTSLNARRPVIFGVLTTENIEQAKARAGGAKGDKGREAARAALETLSALRESLESNLA